MFTPPIDVAEFKLHFDRGFPYGEGLESVRDKDIQSAIDSGVTMFNPALWAPEEMKPAYLLLAAHFLVVTIQSQGGLRPTAPGAPGSVADATKNTGSGVIGQKTVEKVSIQYAGLEALIKEYPSLGAFRQTDFGAQYAMMVGPRLRCRVGIVSNPVAPGIGTPAIPFLS